MTDLPVHLFSGLDGVELAWREVGSGRPFVLLHGLMGSGALLASQSLVPALAGRGFRVILPDLRGHGSSGGPHDAACYPPDILADDVLALIGHLGLDDYDLGGYSMGGKLVLRVLARGARPARAVVGGQGLDALDRAKAMAPETPGQLYFRAISLDGLRQHKPALEAYRQFLAVADGKFPDQEFLSRQRMRIIEEEIRRGIK